MTTISEIVRNNITAFDPHTGEIISVEITVDEDRFLDQLTSFLQHRRNTRIAMKAAQVTPWQLKNRLDNKDNDYDTPF